MPVASKVTPGSLARVELGLEPFLGAQQRRFEALDGQALAVPGTA